VRGLTLLFLLPAALCLGQSHSGRYQANGVDPVAWSISPSRCLIWNGEPYRPFGLRISGSPLAIEGAAAAGIRDVIVELPASGMGWSQAFEALEAKQMRYLIAVNSMAPAAEGFTIEPATYRIGNLMASRTVDFRIPGAQSALVVLASKRDGAVTSSVRIPMPDGRLRHTITIPEGIEHVALIYPEVASPGIPDLWEKFDEHRDGLLRALKTSAPGKGLRGLLNPLGATFRRTGDPPFVPKSYRFREEFAAHLESKYRSKDTAMRLWMMNSAEIDGFSQLARLVPLWQGSRGVGMLWDPKTDKLYPCEQQKSQYWLDVRTVLSALEYRRYNALASGLKKACDIPIVQEWHGWIPWYEAQGHSLDGIGARLTDLEPISVRESAGRAASSAMRWPSPGWLFASSVEAGSLDDIPKIPGAFDDLDGLGVHGAFLRTENPQVVAFLAQEGQRRAQSSFATFSPTPLFYPEVARNPAHTQRLPFSRWWLPAPWPGNRIDLGTQFHAYRLESGTETVTVIWSTAPMAKAKLRCLKPKDVIVTSLDGTPMDRKLHRNAIEISFGEWPIVFRTNDEIPIPEAAILELTHRFDEIIKQSQKLHMDLGDDVYLYRDAARSLDANPGGSMARMTEVLSRMNHRMAPFMWLEAENCRASTFSEVQLSPGASNGAVLSLRSNILGLSDDFHAEFQFQVRTGQEVEVWIAGRIPKEFRGDVALTMGGQTLRIAEPPVSLYGPDLGWYKLGTTRLAGSLATLTVQVTPNIGTDLTLDAVLLYPGAFRPNGTKQPDALSLISGISP
jgi:hypothetical protein